MARSSCGANCAGFKKIETTVRSFSARDLWTGVRLEFEGKVRVTFTAYQDLYLEGDIPKEA